MSERGQSRNLKERRRVMGFGRGLQGESQRAGRAMGLRGGGIIWRGLGCLMSHHEIAGRQVPDVHTSIQSNLC